MLRSLLAIGIMLVSAVAAAEPYLAPAPETVPGYFATVLPCKVIRPGDPESRRDWVVIECKHEELESKSLRELAIMRNTIYARYGWDGFRKTWLRDYFHAQPWFKPNPAFSYKLISDVDKKNAHLIATSEQSVTETQLRRMKWDVYARRGKVWHDVPLWPLVGGRRVHDCERPKKNLDEVELDKDGYGDMEGGSQDCFYKRVAWYKPDPSYTDAKLTTEDKIELGLISRALGSFALDGNIDYDDKGKGDSLDKLLKAGDLRQLSMRDLRLLRNTIYARRGRSFKSQILRDHFTGMSWYKVDPAYTDARLSKTDARNIALIKTIENEFGGPLSDEDYLADPAADGA